MDKSPSLLTPFCFQKLAPFMGILEAEQSLYTSSLIFLTGIFFNVVGLWLAINPSTLLTTSSTLFVDNFMSYTLQLLNVTIMGTLYLTLTTSTPIRRAMTIMVGYFSLTCLAPLQTLAFLSIYTPNSLIHPILTLLFFGFLFISGLMYFHIKQRRPLLNTLGFVTLTCFYIEIPHFLNAYLATVLNSMWYDIVTIININLILFLPIAGIAAYLANPHVFYSLAKDARYLRILHYALMIVLGLALGMRNNPYDVLQIIKLAPDMLTHFLFCLISLMFASLFAIVINNISDIDIDSICNKDRPLVTKAIHPALYSQLGYLFLGLAFFYAMMVEARAFLIISVFMGNYYIYSLPPLRLKRITVLSKLIFSINSIALIVLGYVLVNGEIEDFPVAIYYIYLLFFTIASSVVDLKDIKGDEAAGILTLPVLVGAKKAKLIIGTAAFLSSVSFLSLVGPYYLIVPLMCVGVLQFYLINKTKFNELPVLLASNAGISLLIIYLLAEKTLFIK